MPVDKTMVDPVLSVYRNMGEELKNKKLKGEPVDKFFEVLNEMEQLALDLDDIVELSTKMATKGHFVNASNWYSKALMSTSGSGENDNYSDETLLKNSLAAYENSLDKLKKDPKNAHIVPCVQKVIDMGKSGISFPVFLRKCEEEGVFLNMNSPHARPTIEYDIYMYDLIVRPIEVERNKKLLKAFEELVIKAPFGYPDPLEYELIRQVIEWEYEPQVIKWNAIIHRWDRMLDMIHDWVDSFCAFAPYDDRWAGMGGGNSKAQTMKNIARTQECNPGWFKVRENIFKEYFGLTWDDIWTHPTYEAEMKGDRVWYSDETIQIIKDAYSLCIPGGKPTDEMIKLSEEIHAEKRYSRFKNRKPREIKPMDFAVFLKERGFA